MLLTRRNIRLFIAIALLIAGIALLNIFDNKAQQKADAVKAPASDIDFFIGDAKLTVFDIDGKIVRTATADKVDHFKQAKQSLFDNPVIYNHQDQQITASITSKTAKAIDNDDSITFYDDVLVRNIAQETPDTSLKTQVLHYNRALNHVSTEADVEISDILGNITTATGMHSDINLETLELKSNVKGRLIAK